jgi:protein SCO1
MLINSLPLKSIPAVSLLALSALFDACRSSNTDVSAVHNSAASASGAIAQVSAATSDFSIYDLPSRWQDQHGDTLALRSLGGRVQVVAMVYTECSATCPLILQALKRIEATVPVAQRDRVGFVLVSLDPMRDTPGRLAAWAESVRLDSARWTLLSGSDDAVRELAATLDVRYQSQPDGEIAHTNGITVLDRNGAISHRQIGLGETDATASAVRALLR